MFLRIDRFFHNIHFIEGFLTALCTFDGFFTVKLF